MQKKMKLIRVYSIDENGKTKEYPIENAIELFKKKCVRNKRNVNLYADYLAMPIYHVIKFCLALYNYKENTLQIIEEEKE